MWPPADKVVVAWRTFYQFSHNNNVVPKWQILTADCLNENLWISKRSLVGICSGAVRFEIVQISPLEKFLQKTETWEVWEKPREWPLMSRSPKIVRSKNFSEREIGPILNLTGPEQIPTRRRSLIQSFSWRQSELIVVKWQTMGSWVRNERDNQTP
jgi:hypothetical protein